MTDKNSQRNASMTSTQSAFAAAVLIGFFVIWSLWLPVGKPLLCWLNENPNLGTWAQAIFGFGAVVVAIIVPYIQRQSEKEEEFNRKLKEAEYKFIEILSACRSISERLIGYKSIMESSGSLEREAFQWGLRYMHVFDNIKLPETYEVKDLDIIPGNFSVRLVYIFQMYIGISRTIRFSIETAKESNDPIERNSLMSSSLIYINGELIKINTELVDLSADYQQEFLQIKN